jgi:hypothetical protein
MLCNNDSLQHLWLQAVRKFDMDRAWSYDLVDMNPGTLPWANLRFIMGTLTTQVFIL